MPTLFRSMSHPKPAKAALSSVAALALVTTVAGPAAAQTTSQTSWKLNQSLETTSTTSSQLTEPSTSSTSSDNFTCPSLQIVIVNGQGDNQFTADQTVNSNARLDGMVNAGIEAGNEGQDNQAVARVHVGWKGANRDQQALGSGNRPTLTGEDSGKSTGGINDVEADKVLDSNEAEEVSIEDTAKILSDISKHCPNAKFFITGQGEGAGSAHRTLENIANGSGPIKADKVAGGALYSDPYRTKGQSTFRDNKQTRPVFPKGKNSDDYSKMVSPYTTPAAQGSGVKSFAEANPHLSSFGALADRIGTFCLPMDLVCNLVQQSPVGQIFKNVKATSTTFQQDPIMAIRDLSSSFLGTSIRTASDFVMNDIDFDWDKGQFVINKNPDTVLGRAVGYSTKGRLSEGDLSPIVGSIAKVGGMALGASVTIAKKMISPAALMSYAAAGISGAVAGGTAGGAAGGAIGSTIGGPAAGIVGPLGAAIGGLLGGAAGAVVSAGGAIAIKGATTAMGLVPPNTLAAGAQKIFKEVSALGLPSDVLAKAASQSQMNTQTQQSGYKTTPVSTSGANPMNLGSQWIASLAKMLSGTSTKDALSAGTGLFANLMKGGSITATLTGGTGSGALVDGASKALSNAAPIIGEAGKAVMGAAGPIVESVIPAATSLAGEIIPTAASILTGLL